MRCAHGHEGTAGGSATGSVRMSRPAAARRPPRPAVIRGLEVGGRGPDLSGFRWTGEAAHKDGCRPTGAGALMTRHRTNRLGGARDDRVAPGSSLDGPEATSRVSGTASRGWPTRKEGP